MKSFGKAIRNGLPAIGLGLISTVALVGVTAVSAPVAVAQKVESSKEFVEHYTAAKKAYDSKQWNDVLKETDAGAPFAKSAQEKGALAQMRIVSLLQLKRTKDAIKEIESSPAMQSQFRDQLPGLYDQAGDKAKAAQLTKEKIQAGKGTATDYGYVANNELATKDYKGAIADAQKALQAPGGSASSATFYNIILKAQLDSKDMDGYYATLEKVAPILKKEVYWRPLIERTMKEPKYKSQDAEVDVMRTMKAAGVQLQTKELTEYGEFAYNRGSAIEAETVLEPLVKSGEYGGPKDPKGERDKKLYASIQADAKADKAGDMAKSEADAATKATGEQLVAVGDAYLGAGNYAKAVEVIQKGIAKGQLEPGALELAKLRLGMAQFKAGQKDDAKKTWATVKGDNGSGWLARCWLAIAKS